MYTADFETTTNKDDCRVWAYGLCDIKTFTFKWGKTIDEMIEFLKSDKQNHTLYFHNLKFDGEFILYWLFENGFTHIKNKKLRQEKTFSTLIADGNIFYCIEIYFTKDHKLTIYDSLKIIPFSVEKIAKAFNLPLKKLEINYTQNRPIGYTPTKKEIEYLNNDVEIVARALKTLFDQKLDKMTQGANALADFKNIIGKKKFERWFPSPDYDKDVRRSYRGGVAMVKKCVIGKMLGEGLSFDVNSLYPSVMYYKPLPYGEGIYFEGEYKHDSLYFLYVQCIKCQFELKKDHLPTIQLKHTGKFVDTEYIENSGVEEVVLYLTNIDLKLFFDHYEVYNIEYISGWKFKATTGLFCEYIDKWSKIKIDSKKSGNDGMYTLAKLMLNALYGKFATNPESFQKYPYMENGLVKYRLSEKETRKPVYIPVGTFITSYARETTLRAAQKLYHRFWYCDTDSLHISGREIPDCLEISDTKLGAWKLESYIIQAKFLRAKSYMERVETKEGYTDNITCAGMPKGCYKYVTWDNFKPGGKYKGKLQQKRVRGGIVLDEIEFTIK